MHIEPQRRVRPLDGRHGPVCAGLTLPSPSSFSARRRSDRDSSLMNALTGPGAQLLVMARDVLVEQQLAR